MNLKSENLYKNNKRFSILKFLFILFFFFLFLRLFFLQIINGNLYENLAKKNRLRKERLAPLRGLIFDKNGIVLATNRPAFSLFLDKKNLKGNIKPELEIISKILKVPIKKLENKIKENKYKENIKLFYNLNWESFSKIEALSYFLPGIYISYDSIRYYPLKKIGAHVVGYVQEASKKDLKTYRNLEPGDFVGKYGIEKYFNKILIGKPGYRIIEVDAKGKEIKEIKRVNAKKGDDIYLTIDANLEKKAFNLLKGKAGAIVVMDVHTGKILCLVSSPSFDPNIFARGIKYSEWKKLILNKMRPLTNKAISGVYPPGSTFKVITAISALMNKIVNEKTEIFCPGYFMFKNVKYRCWKRYGHGYVNIVKAIKESCDTYFYDVGLHLGIDKIYKTAIKFGLGFKTDIDLPGESSGLIPNTEWKLKTFGKEWYAGETPSCAIGQGYVLVTPLQMARVYATIANNGILYKPLIVDKIVADNGTIIKEFKPVVISKLNIPKKIFKIIQTALKKVVNEPHGTAYLERIPGFEYSGKTGTAQVRKLGEKRIKNIDKIPYNLRDHAWFIAYAPSDNPQIVVSVLIEHGGHGSSGAAPIAKKIIKYYFGLK